jgi:predicted Zn-dependent protease
MSSMFTMLQRQSGLSAAGRLPEWQSTHPDPENRVARNDRRVAGFVANLDTMRVNRDVFVRTLDGMVFGENPREGYFEGTNFFHPDLKFRLAFPQGWRVQNQPSAVVAASQQQDAMAALSFAQADSPEAALRAFLGQQGIQTVGTSTNAVNGIPAAMGEFRAQTEQAVIQGAVQYLKYDGRLYQLLMYTTPDKVQQYGPAFRQALGSFARLTDPAALNKQPVRVRMVRLDRDMTLKEFQRGYPSAISLAYLAVINGADTTARLRRGDWVKQVR